MPQLTGAVAQQRKILEAGMVRTYSAKPDFSFPTEEYFKKKLKKKKRKGSLWRRTVLTRSFLFAPSPCEGSEHWNFCRPLFENKGLMKRYVHGLLP